MTYKGKRLACENCKFCPKTCFDENNMIKTKGCKMLNNNSVKKLKGFNYCSIEKEDICKYYEPSEKDESIKQNWTGIEDYIEFLDKEYYTTPSFLKLEGKTKIKDIMTIPLIVKTDEEYIYHVSLYDWLTGEAIKNNVIKYKRKYEVKKTKNKKSIPKRLIDINGKDEIKSNL